MGEVKQLNIRVDENSIESFRKFCEENGVSQAQGFDHIIQVVELNKAKAAIPAREQEMESFEMHVKALLDAYLRSLETASDAEEIVKEQFRTELTSKDKTIADCQKKIEDLKVKYSESQDETRRVSKALADSDALLSQAIKDKNAAITVSEEVSKIRDMLQEKNTELEHKLEDYTRIKNQETDFLNNIAELRSKNDKSEISISNLQEKIDGANTTIAQLKENSTQLTSENDKLKHELENIRQQLVAEKTDHDRSYSLLQKESELHEEKALASLRSEMTETIIKLREEIAVLKSKNLSSEA